MCEPGRALVAEAESLIVRVEARRGSDLFINDGGYGVLFDAAHLGWIFPARLVGREPRSDPLIPYELWGRRAIPSITEGAVPAAVVASRKATIWRSATSALTAAPSPATSTAMAVTRRRSSTTIR